MSVFKNPLTGAFNAKTEAISVTHNDRTDDGIDIYLCSNSGNSTLANPATTNDLTVTVADTTGAVVGQCIDISESGKLYQSIIGAINGNVITVKSPIDYDFTAGADVCYGDWNLGNSNGSTGSPVVHCFRALNSDFIIESVSVAMSDDDPMYETKFGSLNQLPNGLVLRRKNGHYKNKFLITNNAGFQHHGFTTEYPDKVPQGIYAFKGEKELINRNGIALQLLHETQDSLELLVRDDLTGLNECVFTIHGYIKD